MNTLRNFVSRFQLALVLAALFAVPLAFAAGFYTNGLTLASSTSYYATNGTASGFTYSAEVGGYELLPLDTQIPGGSAPQTIAASAFQVGALAAAVTGNTATATSGAATLSTTYGVVTSEAITTAAGSTYTLTLTNTTVTATSKVQAAAYLGAGTAGALQVVSITPAAGSVVIVVKNVGSVALNAAIKIPFQVQ